LDQLTLVTFAQDAYFQILGTVFPAAGLLSSVLNLGLSLLQNEPTIWDQIKNKVEATVLKSISEYHQNTVSVELAAYEHKMNNIVTHGFELQREDFLEELSDLSRDMLADRLKFFPTSFSNSIEYNSDVIAEMIKFTCYYMAVNYEIENYYATMINATCEKGCQRIMRERKMFLQHVSIMAVKTVFWALDQRQSHIKDIGTASQLHDTFTNEHINCNRDLTVFMWSKFNRYISIDAGCYAIASRSVRQKALDLLKEFLVKPINMFLAKENMSLIEDISDNKQEYPFTVTGDPCDGPCVNEVIMI
jgi:hypothetical protein